MEVLGKFKIGDIVVFQDNKYLPGVKFGDTFRVREESTEHKLFYAENRYSQEKSNWVLANEMEMLDYIAKLDETSLPQAMEILGKFNIGDIVVVVESMTPFANKGEMYEVLQGSTRDKLYFKGPTATARYLSNKASTWRKATAEECAAYYAGITNIENMDKLIHGKYLINDIVVSLKDVGSSRHNGDIFRVQEMSTSSELYYKSGYSSPDRTSFRSATLSEVEAFEKGITNIFDITRKNVLYQYGIGDIIVATQGNTMTNRTPGDLFEVLPNSNEKNLYYGDNHMSSVSTCWRPASQKEIEMYRNGVKNIFKTEKLILGKFKKGDVIVSLINVTSARNKGDIFTVLPSSSYAALYYKQHTSSMSPEDWRLATPDELALFKEGATNIHQKSKPSKILGKFEIGDIVVSLSEFYPYRLDGSIHKVLDTSTSAHLYYGATVNSQNPNDWRLATPKEKASFQQGCIYIGEVQNSLPQLSESMELKFKLINKNKQKTKISDL